MHPSHKHLLAAALTVGLLVSQGCDEIPQAPPPSSVPQGAPPNPNPTVVITLPVPTPDVPQPPAQPPQPTPIPPAPVPPTPVPPTPIPPTPIPPTPVPPPTPFPTPTQPPQVPVQPPVPTIAPTQPPAPPPQQKPQTEPFPLDEILRICAGCTPDRVEPLIEGNGVRNPYGWHIISGLPPVTLHLPAGTSANTWDCFRATTVSGPATVTGICEASVRKMATSTNR